MPRGTGSTYAKRDPTESRFKEIKGKVLFRWGEMDGMRLEMQVRLVWCGLVLTPWIEWKGRKVREGMLAEVEE